MSNDISSLKTALLLIVESRNRPSQKLLDVIYGPSAAELRATLAGILGGRVIRKSAKEAQYGRLRTALVNAVGANGNCIASVDSDFEEKAKRLIETT